jgi:Animal haem peroxidase
MRRAILTAVAVSLLFTAPAHAGTFGRLFPGLAPLNTQTNQQVADLAQTQLDPNADTDNNCPAGATLYSQCTGSGFTYFGQFLDHDLTLDTSPSPLAPVDPATLTNGRTLAFDLDSVYGRGPTLDPQFYAADGKHFLLQQPNVNGVVDLPRNPDGSALINEGRNDENQVISQIELSIMRCHNRLVDLGLTFAQARKALTVAYQHAIVSDFLPHIMDPAFRSVASALLIRPAARLLALTPDVTTVEFSVAAYRFGHSQVRRAYEVNDTSGKVQVFSLTAPDLRGGQQLTPARKIDWGNFFPDLTGPVTVTNGTPDPTAHVNIGRKIDPLISSSLFVLPIPGAEAAGSNVLAFRNMIRAKFYDMPSGQSVAAALGLPVIAPADLGLAPEWDGGTPLWYYVLAESSRKDNGDTLGPVGSAIVGGTFYAALLKDPDSILRGNLRTPVDTRIQGADGKMTVSDLVTFGAS